MLEWQKGYWDSFVRCGTAAGYGHGYGHGYGYGHGQEDGHLNANTPAFQPVASGVSAHGSGSHWSSAISKQSNEFWNTDAPVFSPVNFFAASSSPQNSQEVERLSRGWDECDLSPLAEERAGSAEGWTTELGNQEAEKKGEEDDETETGEGSGLGFGEGEGGDFAIETAITTPTPQQSARMTPTAAAKSCNDVKLAFCDGTWGDEKGCMDVWERRGDEMDGKDREEGNGRRSSFLYMKDEVLGERKCKSLPWVSSKRLIEVCAGKKEGEGREKGRTSEEEDGGESLRERNGVDQVW
ncbi:predicted protein [Sclerotinia sclerotiorum 1980 UF-70]|uniref:Uncharacterized protein n=2 Tax=Sclerotinia sclerotiorum (strain ATCC 18683 / 1980 / Ss-1) TaxID=665079 RepID=A7ESN7_SCLS1|nr:predicted protein [Sclerotinia sclerotiorum 1980 UF-70]APA12874.1 hypothetical protein sscle_10g076440 [Sclerotinia sclerotiorum 1980 UF-70]EDN92479.1 predicted protein [Sclerotinia sclerotiorum 1980 UF-70]